MGKPTFVFSAAVFKDKHFYPQPPRLIRRNTRRLFAEMTERSIQPELTVYRGWPTQGEHVWSPFVIKLEARLRFAGVPYHTAAGNPKLAPRGKIPYVAIPIPDEPVDSITKMGDSTLIIKHLIQRGTVPDLNAWLSPEDKVKDLALRALLEDKLCFFHVRYSTSVFEASRYWQLTWNMAQMRERWMENYYTMRDHVLSSIPWPVRVVVGQLIYRNARATLYGQGTLRFTKEEVQASKKEIWQAISDALVSARSRSDLMTAEHKGASNPNFANPFWILGGSEPTEADGTLFGFIVSVFLSTAYVFPIF